MQNPFEFGRELGANELVNRIDELAAIRRTIETGGKLFVIGPRRFGKTSLLKSSAEHAERENSIVLRYNAEAFSGIDGLVRKIVEDSAKALQGRIEKTGEHIARYFKALRPELSFSVTQTEWKASLGATPSAASVGVEQLVDALNGLEELASEQKERKVALIIDEFQEILNQAGVLAEKQIRSAIQTHQFTAYVFAGSKTSFLTEMTTNPSRPFYRLGSSLFVGPLPKTEFSRFLLDKFVYGGFFSPKSKEDEKLSLAKKILDVAEDVPYNVQMIAHSLWNRLLEIRIGSPETAFLSEALIADTLETLLRQNDPFYTQVWNGLTAIQKRALSAVARNEGQNLQSAKVTGESGVSASSMRKSLESLTSRDVLRQEELRGSIKFKFEDPFLAAWIRRFTS
ncbi:MAG: ATP-binding protein [Acidobacteria bacterium]|nr:ATP-binding protein [Acidobacteriota bacterium]